MFHVKHLIVDRHSSAPSSAGFHPPAAPPPHILPLTSSPSHPPPHILPLTSHIQRPASNVSRETSLTLEAHTTAPPISIALLRFDLGAPRLRHAPSRIANVSRETSHHYPHTAVQLRLHHPAPLSPRTFTSSDVSRETPGRPKNAKGRRHHPGR